MLDCLCGQSFPDVQGLAEHIGDPVQADAKPDYTIELPGEAQVNEEIAAMEKPPSAEDLFGNQDVKTHVLWRESDSARQALLDQIPLPTFEDGAETGSTVAELPDDPWIHRSSGMRCRTCISYVPKATTAMPDERGVLGRCRKHAPTMNGFPAVFEMDWCGDHKIDEEKL